MRLTEEKIKDLEIKANDIRESIIEMLVEAGSGHTAGPLGMADVFTVFFPLTIVWLFYEAFDAKKKISKAGFMLASAFFSGIFAFAWSG